MEHVSRLSVVRCQESMFCLPPKTNERTLRRLSVGGSKRRVCLQCQTKTRGSWKCAVCQQRKPQLQFSGFIGKRPSGKDGTQICNACHTVLAQAVLRKRAAASSISRLEPFAKNCVGPKCYARHGKRSQNTDKNAQVMARPRPTKKKVQMRLQAPKKWSKSHQQKRFMCTHALFAKNLLLRQLLPDMSTTDACVGDNFACRMAFFGRRCRQRTFRTHALLVEPASRAPKNLGESNANTNNLMAACAPERNGMQSNDKRPVPAVLSASNPSITFSCRCCRGCCRRASNLLVLLVLLLAVK